MKKLILVFILIIFMVLLTNFNAPVFAKDIDRSFLGQGISVSNIDLSTFLIKNGSIPVNSYFIEDPNSLVDIENIAYKNGIRTFVKLDLLLYPFESTKPANVSDLVKFYKENSNLSLLEQQKLLAVIASLFKANGKAVTEVKQSEPEIVITYKYESTKTGYIAIPVRTPKMKNTLTTNFYLDPLSFPYKDLTSYYQFLKGTIVDQSNILTKAARRKYQNPFLDFDGFYIALPDKVTYGYEKVIKSSISALKKDIGNKIIVFTNVTKENANLVKDVGDVFVANVNDNRFDEVRAVREILANKRVIANYNGRLNDTDIRNFLDICTIYGLTPQFGRDLTTNDYFYYEADFSKFSPIISESLRIISRVNNLDYKETKNFENYEVSEFNNKSVSSYVFKGNGSVKLEIGSINPQNINTIGGIGNKRFISDGGKNFLVFDINGIGLVELHNDNFYVETTTIKPTTFHNVSVIFRNGTSENIHKKVISRVPGNERSFDLDLSPFEIKSIDLDKDESIIVEGLTFENIYESSNIIPQFFLVIVILAFAFVLYKKEFPIKRLLNKAMFITLSLLLSIVLILCNLKFLGYSIISISYLIMSGVFLMYVFYRGRSKMLSFAFVYIALFAIYNLVEFQTLMPHNQVVFPPYPTFEVILFYFALIFALAILLTFERKISKIEIANIFIIFAFLFVFGGLPFLAVERTELFVYLPFLLISVLFYISIIIDKELKNKLFSTIVILIVVALEFVLPYANKFIINELLNLNLPIYPLSYVFLMIPPLIFFALTNKENTNVNYVLDFNGVVVSLTVIFELSALLGALGSVGLSNPLYFYIGYIIQFVPFILLMIILTETVAR